MLTRKELKELLELHGSVYHYDCFSAREVRRESELYQKATPKQLEKVADKYECTCFY